MFVVARIASPAYGKDDANIFGVSDRFQAFLNSGLTGAVTTTIIGSLVWRYHCLVIPTRLLVQPPYLRHHPHLLDLRVMWNLLWGVGR